MVVSLANLLAVLVEIVHRETVKRLVVQDFRKTLGPWEIQFCWECSCYRWVVREVLDMIAVRRAAEPLQKEQNIRKRKQNKNKIKIKTTNLD